MNSLVFDISTRVSQVGGRSEDRLYSDDNQEAVCREFILERMLGTVGIVTRERNVSGGKAAKDRALEKLIQRVESGESNGIVVYDWSRFSREEPFAAMMTVGRIHNAGGVVRGVIDNYDSSGPMAVVQTAIYAEQAHNYLKTARERTAAGRKKALENGKWITRKPACYDIVDGELVAGELSWLPQKIYEMKLDGVPQMELVRFAKQHGLNITVGGIRTMLKNPVYIGESEWGPSPALVDKKTFDRVQKTRKTRTAPTAAAKTLCQTLALCSNCGSTLIAHLSGATHYYYCRGQKLGGCETRAYVQQEELDAYVEEQFLGAFKDGGPLARAYADHIGLTETANLRDEAQAEHDAILANTTLLAALGADAAKVVENAKAKLDMAEAAHRAAKTQADTLGGTVAMLADWKNRSLAQKRRMLATGIERIMVGRGRVPVERKVTVIFKGGVVVGAPDDAGAGLVLVED